MAKHLQESGSQAVYCKIIKAYLCQETLGIKKERADQFAFINKDNRWIVEAGDMSVLVGASSEDIRLRGRFSITDSKEINPRTRGFYSQNKEHTI